MWLSHVFTEEVGSRTKSFWKTSLCRKSNPIERDDRLLIRVTYIVGPDCVEAVDKETQRKCNSGDCCAVFKVGAHDYGRKCSR